MRERPSKAIPIMDVDYTKFLPGHALSDAIILVRCPLCLKSARLRRNRSKGDRYVHAVRIEMRHYAKSKIKKKVCVVTALCRETPGAKREREREESKFDSADFPF